MVLYKKFIANKIYNNNKSYNKIIEIYNNKIDLNNIH